MQNKKQKTTLLPGIKIRMAFCEYADVILCKDPDSKSLFHVLLHLAVIFKENVVYTAPPWLENPIARIFKAPFFRPFLGVKKTDQLATTKAEERPSGRVWSSPCEQRSLFFLRFLG